MTAKPRLRGDSVIRSNVRIQEHYKSPIVTLNACVFFFLSGWWDVDVFLYIPMLTADPNIATYHRWWTVEDGTYKAIPIIYVPYRDPRG